MQKSSRANIAGLTLIEVMVAAAVLALTTIAMTQAMLVLNRNSAIARVRNLAKAMVLGRIQEVAALAYDPTASPAVIPTPLALSNTTTSVNLGDSTAGVGSLPATLTWNVTNVGATTIRQIKVRVDYTYLNRKQNYEVVTFRAPD